MSYIVKFSKYFVNGNLKGIFFDTSLSFASLDAANDYMAFLHRHAEKPVKAIGSNYTCHMARIVRG